VWKTVYSERGIHDAWMTTALTFPILLMWTVLPVFSERSAAGGVAYAACVVLVPAVIWRYASVRVETHPDGVLVVNRWRSHFVPWAGVDKVEFVYRQVELPADTDWDAAVARDPSLVLFDMYAGPQQISMIALRMHDGWMLMVDTVSRRSLLAISDGERQYRQARSSWSG
jgi:hypothetical protein